MSDYTLNHFDVRTHHAISSLEASPVAQDSSSITANITPSLKRLKFQFLSPGQNLKSLLSLRLRLHLCLRLRLRGFPLLLNLLQRLLLGLLQIPKRLSWKGLPNSLV